MRFGLRFGLRLVASPEFRDGLVAPPRFREASLSSHAKSNPERISVHFPKRWPSFPNFRDTSTSQEMAASISKRYTERKKPRARASQSSLAPPWRSPTVPCAALALGAPRTGRWSPLLVDTGDMQRRQTPTHTTDHRGGTAVASGRSQMHRQVASNGGFCG